MGKHRLACGDSTDASCVNGVMQGKKSQMMFTDPPWNVAIGKDSNPRHRQRAGLDNDDLSPQDFRDFLSAFIRAAQPHIDGDIYCVLGASEWPTLDSVLREHGFHWSATVIWVKHQFVLGRAKYHRRYEPIWYGWHVKNKSSFCDARNLDDVWEIPRPTVSAEHPTMKPVALVERAIENSSRRGAIVFEPFSGGGSTIIAAEKTGRICYAIELSPAYVDVAVRRWQEFTGDDARLESTGETFMQRENLCLAPPLNPQR